MLTTLELSSQPSLQNTSNPMGNTGSINRESASLPFAYAKPTDSSQNGEREHQPAQVVRAPRLNQTQPLDERPTTPRRSSLDATSTDEVAMEGNDTKGLKVITLAQLNSTTTVGLCSQGLAKLSPNVGLLYNTTTLQLCCNELTHIPPEIGHLQNLQIFSISRNQIRSLPDTIGLLSKLVELRASENELESIPSSIGRLTKLTTLSLDNNRIACLPFEIGDAKALINLDLSQNPITVLPAEIGRLKFLRKFRLDDCPLASSFQYRLENSVPTLKELAARVIVRRQVPIVSHLQDELQEYLTGAHRCSFCGGPYFESFAKRGKFIEKADYRVPLEYRLCVPHWNTEEERISLLFRPLPETAPQKTPQPGATPAGTPPGSPKPGKGRQYAVNQEE
ncbi:L domain-like protein [Gonapodya prolifera JEL478]|uniref:L domain-like protein n=1 Tax=Gonapodya prolifera (strain JEL478) TaxID=1344416 RepID=A0A139AVR1_GONPJ|nr:L domain-like protein [Gonapodya prolifera JEL478]|eukprot:KXS20822.1 L domain-like protein [Gonapodya prolifera JEL478]